MPNEAYTSCESCGHARRHHGDEGCSGEFFDDCPCREFVASEE